MIWRVRVASVRERDNGGYRWTFNVATDDLETTAVADSTRRGSILYLESDEHIGSAGDPELDYLIGQEILEVLAKREAIAALDAIDRRTHGRSDRWRA